LDGEDKMFGYIVDYKDLFPKVETAIAVYTSELDHSAEGAPPEVLLHDRMTKGRERLEAALETLDLLCEPVEPPKGTLEYIRYFCGNVEIAADLEERAPLRAALYKAVVGLVRAYANLADELERAGYSAADVERIERRIKEAVDLRQIVRNAAGETLDLKPYEADMRHLIDTYIEADEPRKISPFDDIGLLDLIVKTGIVEAIAERLGGLKGNRDAIAETIENNVRSKIIKEHLSDPAYYATMSAILDEIIAARKAKALEYEEYLKRIAEMIRRVDAGVADDAPEPLKRSAGLRALYNNLKAGSAQVRPAALVAEPPFPYELSGDPVLDLAVRLDGAIKRERPDGWRGVQAREQVIKSALYEILEDVDEVERLFPIVKAQREY
jgi:type I restriction enzyme R subunit